MQHPILPQASLSAHERRALEYQRYGLYALMLFIMLLSFSHGSATLSAFMGAGLLSQANAPATMILIDALIVGLTVCTETSLRYGLGVSWRTRALLYAAFSINVLLNVTYMWAHRSPTIHPAISADRAQRRHARALRPGGHHP